MIKKSILAGLLLIFAVSFLGAIDLLLRPRAFALFPMGEGDSTATGLERYSPGGGGALLFDADLSGVWPNPFGLGYTAGLEAGAGFAPYKSPAEGTLQLDSFGGGLGVHYYLLSRLLLRLDGSLGVYQGTSDGSKSKPGLWWRAGGEAGFRFSPGFTLGINGGWLSYSAAGRPLWSGLYAGLSAQITLETGGDSSSVTASLSQDDAVYPAFLSLYQTTEAARLTIHNGESAEIRNVRVSFRAAGYTSSEFACGEAEYIAKRQSAELPLYADFSPELLNFTDRGRILGEVVIRYTLLGAEKTAVRQAALRVHGRNTFPPGDTAGLAAFVSPTTPELLEYSKYITGLARGRRRTGLNQNMQFGVWLFEGLRAQGVDITGGEKGAAQFPSQTLAYRSGSAADVALLYAGALEAAGIRAGYIPLNDGDCITVFSLDIGEAAARTLFTTIDKLLIVDEEVWLPLSANSLGEGFMAAWNTAVSKIEKLFASGEEAELTILDYAWQRYPPSVSPGMGARLDQAASARTAANAAAALDAYRVSELEPLYQALQRQAQSAPAAAAYSRLGMAALRTGRNAEAKTAYEKAAALGSAAAMTNRGNLALVEKDFIAAEKWFRQALRAEPQNKAAVRGLEQITANRGE